MVECFLEWGTDENLGAGAQDWKGGKKASGKKDESYLLIRAVNIEHHPHSPQNSPAPKGCVNGMVGLPTPVMMRIP